MASAINTLKEICGTTVHNTLTDTNPPTSFPYEKLSLLPAECSETIAYPTWTNRKRRGLRTAFVSHELVTLLLKNELVPRFHLTRLVLQDHQDDWTSFGKFCTDSLTTVVFAAKGRESLMAVQRPVPSVTSLELHLCGDGVDELFRHADRVFPSVVDLRIVLTDSLYLGDSSIFQLTQCNNLVKSLRSLFVTVLGSLVHKANKKRKRVEEPVLLQLETLVFLHRVDRGPALRKMLEICEPTKIRSLTCRDVLQMHSVSAASTLVNCSHFHCFNPASQEMGNHIVEEFMTKRPKGSADIVTLTLDKPHVVQREFLEKFGHSIETTNVTTNNPLEMLRLVPKNRVHDIVLAKGSADRFNDVSLLLSAPECLARKVTVEVHSLAFYNPVLHPVSSKSLEMLKVTILEWTQEDFGGLSDSLINADFILGCFTDCPKLRRLMLYCENGDCANQCVQKAETLKLTCGVQFIAGCQHVIIIRN